MDGSRLEYVCRKAYLEQNTVHCVKVEYLSSLQGQLPCFKMSSGSSMGSAVCLSTVNASSAEGQQVSGCHQWCLMYK